ncbi:MAG TPA: AI-2E family transporter [Nocardioidaceae bacterium]|nr:AI-2E family transporter [Nocardioidaceae bacterium]
MSTRSDSGPPPKSVPATAASTMPAEGVPSAGSTAAGDARTSTSWVTPGVRGASEWAWRLGVIALGLYVLTRIFIKFADIFIPLMVALLLAALLLPVVSWLAGHMPRGLAALTALLGTLLALIGLFALVGQQAVSGFPELRDQGEEGLKEVRNWLSTGPLNLSAGQLSDYAERAQDAASENRATIVSGALGAAVTVTHLAEGFFIAMFATFFFLSSGQRIWAWLLRMMPQAAQRPLDGAARSGWVTLSHYVRATLIVAFVDAVGIGLGALILGVPLALPLAVVVFLGAFIPVVGAVLTGLLAVLVALVANGPVIALAILAVVILVNQVEAHVLQPFLLGRAVDVHPLAVILAIATGASLAGIVGALFAVPVAAVANTVVTALVGSGRDDPGERIVSEGAPLTPDAPAETDVDRVADAQRSAITGASKEG